MKAALKKELDRAIVNFTALLALAVGGGLALGAFLGAVYGSWKVTTWVFCYVLGVPNAW